MSVVDIIFKDWSDISSILDSSNEVSLKIVSESNLTKIVILSSASYFESILTSDVLKFVSEITNNNILISSLVETKVINRQYHTWFDWEKNNANKFFSLFGKEFSVHMKNLIDRDVDLSSSINSFMEVGRERNKIVHNNYAAYSTSKTPQEAYDLYRDAVLFVEVIGDQLRICSDKLKIEQ